MRGQIPRWNGVSQDDWHTITPGPTYTAGSPDPEYLIDGEGNVHMRGQIVRNAAASGAVAFTLPDGYRPTGTAKRPILTLPDLTSTGRIAVATNGDVTLHERTGTVTNYYIDCSFTVL